MNELSLYTGAGGGLLGTHLLGWRCVGAVEIEEYPCKILAARQEDKCLPYFPIWNMDIRDFNETVAPTYKGMVDVITAGFPCTPFSNAGQQLGQDDERNMWPSTLDCIREVRPAHLLLENVPALLTSGYFGTILGQLSDSGYDCRWRILSAAELGAPHLRKRLWLVAHAQRGRRAGSLSPGQNSGQSQNVGGRQDSTHDEPIRQGWWQVEPSLDRMAYGISDRLGQLKSLGNAQVPSVAARAWELLNEF